MDIKVGEMGKVLFDEGFYTFHNNQLYVYPQRHQ